jgi:ribosomal protein S1
LPIDAFAPGENITAEVVEIKGHNRAFCNIGAGNLAVLYISDTSQSPPEDIRSVLKVGDIVDARVKQIDKTRGRITLTTRKDTKPISAFEYGQEVMGTVTSIRPWGVYFNIGADNDAMLHISDLSRSPPENINDFKIGAVVETRVKAINNLKGQVALTRRHDTKSVSAFVIGQEVSGKVVSIGSSEAHCDIGADNNAVLHISDISQSPLEGINDVVKVGDIVKARVKKLDTLLGRIDLTKQVGTKPINAFEIGEEVRGKVVYIESGWALCNIGSDDLQNGLALLHKRDFSERPPEDMRDMLKVGDAVEARVNGIDKTRGRVTLTTRKDTRPINHLVTGQLIFGKVTSIHPWGAYCDIGADRAATLSISDISQSPPKDMHGVLKVGDAVKARVKGIDKSSGRVTLTTREDTKSNNAFAIGQEVTGKIIGIKPWGAFCNICADDNALLHISDISQTPPRDIRDVLKVGDAVQARVKGRDKNGNRISLTTREDTKPMKDFKIGDKVVGKVMSLTSWGAYCHIGADVNALLHISDISKSPPENINHVLKVGDAVEARVKAIDEKHGRIGLTKRWDDTRPGSHFELLMSALSDDISDVEFVSA